MKKLSIFVFIISILFTPLYFSQARSISGGPGGITYGECGTGISFENFSTKSELGLLCDVGSSSRIILSDTGNLYTWNCNGSVPDANALCFAKNNQNNTDDDLGDSNTDPINGLCAILAENINPRTPGTNLCSRGEASRVLEARDSSYHWSCSGINGGDTDKCFYNNIYIDDVVIDGACGTYDGIEYTTTPTNLCSAGNPENFPGDSLASYSWECVGSLGNTASCTMPKNITINLDGECGVASEIIAREQPRIGLCVFGEVLPFEGKSEARLVDGEWRWICQGMGSGKNSQLCSTPIIPTCTSAQTLIDNVCIDDTPTCTDTETLVDDACVACDTSTHTIIDNVCTEKPIDDTSKMDASSDAGGLIPKCPASGCGFEEFIVLINKVIKFLLFSIATPLAALAFTYAGFLLISAGGDPGKLTQAKSIIKNVLIGFVIALAAWLIVNTILSSLGFTGTFLTK